MKHELIIGKYTLESLTNGMYASPLDLYREYVQNSVDSIDDAASSGIEQLDKLNIQIVVDAATRSISIKDNGCGIHSDYAVCTLIDIGNSGKSRTVNRGFRGIGRLAGLGYCDELVFITSALGDTKRTIVRFDAKKLTKLLLTKDEKTVTVNDVISQVVTTSQESESSQKHYFEVILLNVSDSDSLLDINSVKEYLLQHAPILFAKDFQWGRTISEKVKLEGYQIPTYNISLNNTPLFKPYGNTFVSDRIKKTTDLIHDIHIQPFFHSENLSAILWYAESSFFGTVNDNLIKGIRVRQGNILIGDRTTCNPFFKEERFNGWIIGELHVVDPDLIANSRRDNFEKNESYYCLVEEFKKWASSLSKTIRTLSYERNLTREKKAILDTQEPDDINGLCVEDLSFADGVSEANYLDSSESQAVAESDYIGKLASLLEQKKLQTKYVALNINTKLTIEQRKVLERVFDLIQAGYDKDTANDFINVISKQF